MNNAEDTEVAVDELLDGAMQEHIVRELFKAACSQFGVPGTEDEVRVRAQPVAWLTLQTVHAGQNEALTDAARLPLRYTLVLPHGLPATQHVLTCAWLCSWSPTTKASLLSLTE